jgi:malonyl-CoA O-methyltransferase
VQSPDPLIKPDQNQPGAVDKREVVRAFGRAAAHYDAHAVLQREIVARLAERLALFKFVPSRIVDVGCGTGHGLPYLQQAFPGAALMALDIALPMLHASRQKQAPLSLLDKLRKRVRYDTAPPMNFLCADMEHLPLKTSSQSMLWSSLALQWADDTEACLREWHRVLGPGGLLMFATLGPDTLKELRQAFSQIDGGEHVSRFTDLHDIGDMLVHAGFQNPVMEMEMLTLTYAELKSLMQDLKGIGAHNAASARPRGMMGKQAWKKLQAAYEGFRREGRLPASYEVIYGHAWVGGKTRLEDGRHVIQFNIQQRKAGLR